MNPNRKTVSTPIKEEEDLNQELRRQNPGGGGAGNPRATTQRPHRPGERDHAHMHRRQQPAEEIPSLVYKYRIRSKIGGGSFGSIHKAVHVHTGEEVAIKLESIKANLHQLSSERNIYQILSGGVGVPTMKWYGAVENYNALVMDLLGPSLEDVFNYCRRTFSLKTILMIAEQMLQRIEYVHSKNYIHRDIKPENFVTGLNKKSSTIHLIDFGLAKRYRDPGTHMHIPWKGDKKLTGTARYASVNTHMGSEQSRRDDIESIGYVLVYFSKGRLPWQGINGKTDQEKYKLIGETKKNTDLNALCNGLPEEFVTYLRYSRDLKFEEKPDYPFLRRLFRQVFIREGYQYDGQFDWIIKYQKANASANIQSPEQLLKAIRQERQERQDRLERERLKDAPQNQGGGQTGNGAQQQNTGQRPQHSSAQHLTPSPAQQPPAQKRGILSFRSKLPNWMPFKRNDKKKDKDKEDDNVRKLRRGNTNLH